SLAMNQNRSTDAMSFSSLAKVGPFLGAFSLAALVLAQSPEFALFRDWTRVSEDPVLSPTGDGWQSAGTFNPAVVVRDGKYVMLYRAQDAGGTSRLGYAESADGI